MRHISPDEPIDTPLFVRMTATLREKVRKRAKRDGFKNEADWVRKTLQAAVDNR